MKQVNTVKETINYITKLKNHKQRTYEILARRHPAIAKSYKSHIKWAWLSSAHKDIAYMLESALIAELTTASKNNQHLIQQLYKTNDKGFNTYYALLNIRR